MAWILLTILAVCMADFGESVTDGPDENCEWWADTGLCEKNPGYLLWNCKKSCKEHYCKAFGEEHTMCKYPEPNAEGLCGKYLQQGISQADKDLIVREHNRLRQKVASGREPPLPKAKKMPNLVWDEGLAIVAQRWTDTCKKGKDDKGRDKLIHDEDRSTDKWRWAGQNGGGSDDWADLITGAKGGNGWYDKEYKEFIKDYQKHGDLKNRRWDKYGHFAAVIWHDTTHVGCGYTKWEKDGKQGTLSYCNYGPPGNYPNENVYEEKSSSLSFAGETSWDFEVAGP